MKKEFGYVQDREGNAVAGAEVYIKKQADSTLLTIYSDNGVTPVTNPLTTDNDGEWSAYFADNVVKIQTFVEGVQQQEVNNHQHFDLSGLADPGADRLAGWDDSASAITYFTLGTGLSITDTTLNTSAYLTGGTDVALADGGTGASLVDPNADRIMFWDDSGGAVTWLAPSTGIVITGTDILVDEATTANVLANTADKFLSTDQTWAAAGYTTLNDSGGNIAVDMSTGINFAMTMDGDYTLSNPTNTKDGQQGEIVFTQDGTGNQTLAFGSNWKFAGGTDPTLSTAAGAIDILSYKVINSTFIIAALAKAFA